VAFPERPRPEPCPRVRRRRPRLPVGPRPSRRPARGRFNKLALTLIYGPRSQILQIVVLIEPSKNFIRNYQTIFCVDIIFGSLDSATSFRGFSCVQSSILDLIAFSPRLIFLCSVPNS
jgi:hypothetical protein